MEKKQGRKGVSSFQGTTLREENTGKKHVNVNSILKTKHLQRLATWACVEAKIPPLGALFGNRLAANAEAVGIPLDPSTSLCQRCESILQPGVNCTVRIEKIKNKAKCRKKQRNPSQNNTVYTCHFCSHRNLKGGTPKGHVKGLLNARKTPNSGSGTATKPKIHPKQESALDFKCSTPGSATAARDAAPIRSPITPLLGLDNSSKKKRKTSVPIPIRELGYATTDSGKGNSGSNKRRRKGWSRLKDIAESNEAENNRSISNLAIPFLLHCERGDGNKLGNTKQC